MNLHLANLTSEPSKLDHDIDDGEASTIAMRMETEGTPIASKLAVIVYLGRTDHLGNYDVSMLANILETACQIAQPSLRDATSREEGLVMNIVWSEFCHRLNNPLWNIRLGIENLEMTIDRGANTESIKQQIAVLSESLAVANDSQSELRSMLSHSSQHADVKTDDVRACIKAACDRFEENLIELKILAGLPAVRGHQVVWRRCLENLLMNAQEANTKKQKIELNVSRNDDFLTINVIDSGEGLQAESSEIFSAGYTTKKGNGLPRGFGLSFCRWMLEHQYNGRLTVKNRSDGPGVIASMSIPIYEAPNGNTV